MPAVSTPAPRPPLRQLLLAKFGRLTCRHAYGLMLLPHRMWLRCHLCGQESEGFWLGPRPRDEQ